MIKQCKTQIKVHIYCKNNFLAELLKLHSKHYLLKSYKTCLYPKFDFMHHHNILIIHYDESFDHVVQWSDKLHVACRFIVIANQPDLIKIEHNKNIHAMCAPIYHQDLFKFTDISMSHLRPLSPDIILNTELRLIVKVKGVDIQTVSLTDKELALILYLQDNCEGVKRQDILNQVFGYNNLTDTNTLETHICRLRQKIGDGIKFIKHRNDRYKLLIEESTL